ncbi:MAG TPA: RDD family protein [Thermoanaerobaculia bacterium]|nr:RDD family protein [Thermoanaerobaculia bacterium]
MSGFCKECGALLKLGDSQCPNGHQQGLVAHPALRPEPLQKIGPLPKPSTPRRLLGSGIEYVAYVFFTWVVTFLDSLTAGIAGLLALIVAGLVMLRDCNAGALSIAKRVSQMRVVDRRTGQPASNLQGLVRNGYYFGLLVIAAFVPWFDWISSGLFMAFIAVDIAMIVANPRGRRLGDLLAGTQVIEARG